MFLSFVESLSYILYIYRRQSKKKKKIKMDCAFSSIRLDNGSMPIEISVTTSATSATNLRWVLASCRRNEILKVIQSKVGV